VTDDAKQEHDSVAKSVVNLYRFDTENDRLRALEAIAVYKIRQPQTDALELEIKRLREIVYRYVDPFDVVPEDEDFVQAAQRAALDQSK